MPGQNKNGRVLHDEGGVRVVELSSSTSQWSTPVYQQKVVVVDASGWHDPSIRLYAPDEGGIQREIYLTFEEMDTLISAYQTFLADQEQAMEARHSDPFFDEPF